MAKSIYAMRRGFSMKLSLILSFLFLLASAAAFAQTGGSSMTPWDGRKVFAEKGCNKCHSVRGKGANRAPDLGESRYYGTYLEFASLMWNHFPKMSRTMEEMGSRYPEFTTEEMKQLIAYLSYQRYTFEKGSEFQGRKHLRNKGCFRCHRFGGEGGSIGPDISKLSEHLSPLKLVETMWNHGPEMMELFSKYNIKRPDFSGREIVDMAVAIQSYLPGTNRVSPDSYDMGNPDVGARIVTDKGCLKCHSSRGQGGKRAPAFKDIEFDCTVTQIAGRMWNHGAIMWSAMKKQGIIIPKFESGEMAHVLAYLFNLHLEDAPGSATDGYNIINQKRCLSCHSLNNRGGKIACNLAKIEGRDTPIAMITKMWNHAPAMRKKQIEQKFSWEELTGLEMANLYALFRKNSEEKGSNRP